MFKKRKTKFLNDPAGMVSDVTSKVLTRFGEVKPEIWMMP